MTDRYRTGFSVYRNYILLCAAFSLMVLWFLRGAHDMLDDTALFSLMTKGIAVVFFVPAFFVLARILMYRFEISIGDEITIEEGSFWKRVHRFPLDASYEMVRPWSARFRNPFLRFDDGELHEVGEYLGKQNLEEVYKSLNAATGNGHSTVAQTSMGDVPAF